MTDLFGQQKPLSESLDQLEIAISKIGQGSSKRAEEVLHEMDAIEKRFTDLQAQQNTLSAENAQFEFISNNLKKNARAFLKDVGGIQRLRELRRDCQAENNAWWWFLDEYQAQKTRSSQKRMLITGGIIIAVLAILVLVYQRFLAPSPITQAEMTYESNVSDLLINGNPTGAIDSATKGLQISPNDTTLIILKGIAQLQIGQQNAAAQTFSQAETLLGSHETFLLNRSIAYIRIGDNQAALNDAQQVVTMDPQSAEAYYYVGTAYKGLGDSSSAYQAYETASSLAESQNKTELVATIRIQMALLLQGMDVPGLNATPTVP